MEDVKQLLKKHVESRKMFRFSRKHKEFEGDVSDDRFQIMRIIHNRNSWLPAIRGQMRRVADGTVIAMNLDVIPWVKGFLIFWLLMVCVFTLFTIAYPFFAEVEMSGLLADAARGMGKFSGFIALPFGFFMAAMAIGMSWFFFYIEFVRAKETFRSILNQEDVAYEWLDPRADPIDSVTQR